MQTNITREPPMDQTLVDTVIQATTMSVIIILTVFCNALVLVAFYKHTALQTFTNAFVVNLAVTDICLGVLGTPLSLVASITIDWVAGDFMCQYDGFVQILFTEASIWTLVFVSFERYLAVRHPFRHQRFVTPDTVAASVGLVWVIAVVFASLPFATSAQITFQRFAHLCTVDWRIINFEMALVYCMFSMFIPFSIMCWCNVGVLKTALEQNRKMDVKVGNIRPAATADADNLPEVISTTSDAAETTCARLRVAMKNEMTKRRRETKATILVLALICSFAICWIPYTITTMCLMTKSYQCTWSSRIFVASAWLGRLNSALNPIFYAVFNVTFRRAMKKVLGINRNSRVSIAGAIAAT